MNDHLKPIGILGGTFDPIHFGHLRSALELYQQCDLAEVRLIPCATPSDRDAPLATADARLTMLHAAVLHEPPLTIDDREIRRGGISYTVDTLTSLREDVGEQPLCLILGADRLETLPTWHQWERLIELSHLLLIPRPGYLPPTEGAVAELLAEHTVTEHQMLHEASAGHIFFSPVTALDISATFIRQQIKQGLSPRYLVPNSVLAFIHEHRWYLS